MDISYKSKSYSVVLGHVCVTTNLIPAACKRTRDVAGYFQEIGVAGIRERDKTTMKTK